MFSVLLILSKHDDDDDAPSCSSSSNAYNSLTSVATACLISLAIARGETKSMFQAIASLFMCPRRLASQKLKVRLKFLSSPSIFFTRVIKELCI